MSDDNKLNNTSNTNAVDNKSTYETELENEVSTLRAALDKSKSGELTNADLERISNQEKDFIYKNQPSKKSMVDQIYKKKGIFYYWTIKLPVKILNVGSILDNQKIINDNFRALSSPICPVCGKGILMYDLKKEEVNGHVLWFCSKGKSCDYEVWAEPSVMGVFNDDLAKRTEGVDRHKIWTDQWLKLTEPEKNDLIQSHLLSAVIYRNISFIVALVVFAQVVFKWWWSFSLSFLMLIAVILLSLRWGYFAWRIKTGERGFLEWIRKSKSFYNVDWVNDKSNH